MNYAQKSEFNTSIMLCPSLCVPVVFLLCVSGFCVTYFIIFIIFFACIYFFFLAAFSFQAPKEVQFFTAFLILSPPASSFPLNWPPPILLPSEKTSRGHLCGSHLQESKCSIILCFAQLFLHCKRKGSEYAILMLKTLEST